MKIKIALFTLYKTTREYDMRLSRACLVLTTFLVSGCVVSRTNHHYLDDVKFSFNEENKFYERSCEDRGVVVEKLNKEEYMIGTWCSGRSKTLRVREQDIIAVTKTDTQK